MIHTTHLATQRLFKLLGSNAANTSVNQRVFHRKLQEAVGPFTKNRFVSVTHPLCLSIYSTYNSRGPSKCSYYYQECHSNGS